MRCCAFSQSVWLHKTVFMTTVGCPGLLMFCVEMLLYFPYVVQLAEQGLLPEGTTDRLALAEALQDSNHADHLLYLLYCAARRSEPAARLADASRGAVE
jgi:hypothetical protein